MGSGEHFSLRAAAVVVDRLRAACSWGMLLARECNALLSQIVLYPIAIVGVV